MDETGAEIRVISIPASEGVGPERSRQLDAPIRSQREALELAREESYYHWPREVSIRKLTAEMGISKTTLLEHLCKAESKLLDP